MRVAESVEFLVQVSNVCVAGGGARGSGGRGWSGEGAVLFDALRCGVFSQGWDVCKVTVVWWKERAAMLWRLPEYGWDQGGDLNERRFVKGFGERHRFASCGVLVFIVTC